MSQPQQSTNKQMNKFLGEQPADKNNEASVLKSKIMSIVTSLEVMDEEKENIKEILSDLKASHDIPPKVARAVAKIIHKGTLKDLEDEYNAIEQLHEKVTK